MHLGEEQCLARDELRLVTERMDFDVGLNLVLEAGTGDALTAAMQHYMENLLLVRHSTSVCIDIRRRFCLFLLHDS